jgi:hypothetical protein
MPPLKDNASTFKGSGGGVEKVGRHGKGGGARTAFRSTIAAVTSHQNWSDIAHEVSSGSSEQEEGKRRSLGRASSDENCRLACPYAKLNSVSAIQSMGGSGDLDRPRCWSKSYPNIPRLKYAGLYLWPPLNHMMANDSIGSTIGSICIAFTAGQNSYAVDANRSSLLRNCLTLTAVERQYVIQAKLHVLEE